MSLDPEEFERLHQQFLRWDPDTQAQVAEALALARSTPYVWYCARGRVCDGKPHEGAPNPHARGDQWPPEGKDWSAWLALGGRGSGKTRSGSEWTRKKTERAPRIAIVGPTVSHVRDVMVEGESGIIRVCERAGRTVKWEPSKRKITCANGATIHTYSGEEPDRLRGPEHYNAWLDEPAHMPAIEDVWSNLMLGLRLGAHPQVYCTTTPLPTAWVKERVKDPDVQVVRVSTYVNLDNLAPTFRNQVLSRYEGTRLGRQELHGEVLEDVEGALWNWEIIDRYRSTEIPHTDMERIIIGIDPSGTSSKKRDETGIVAVGRIGDHLYVLADRSGHYTPDGWARTAWSLYDELQADLIVAEKNYGGEMVLSTLRNARKGLGKIDLVHSRRGKALRAEPIVGLYEQGRVHHTLTFTELEEQQTTWVPGEGDSPDRVDALVHAATAHDLVAAPAQIALPFGDMGLGGGWSPTTTEELHMLGMILHGIRGGR